MGHGVSLALVYLWGQSVRLAPVQGLCGACSQERCWFLVKHAWSLSNVLQAAPLSFMPTGCSCAGFPLDKLLQNVPTKRLAGIPLAGAAFVPPTNVQAVAKAAVAAATDPSVPSGIMDVWAIHEYSHQL